MPWEALVVSAVLVVFDEVVFVVCLRIALLVVCKTRRWYGSLPKRLVLSWRSEESCVSLGESLSGKFRTAFFLYTSLFIGVVHLRDCYKYRWM